MPSKLSVLQDAVGGGFTPGAVRQIAGCLEFIFANFSYYLKNLL